MRAVWANLEKNGPPKVKGPRDEEKGGQIQDCKECNLLET